MYTPLQIKQRPNTGYKTSLMPKKGLNLEDDSQMMDTAYALKVTNYIPHRFGLEKRKGLTKIFERAGTDPITLLKEYRNNIWIVGYSTKLEAYDENTDTWTTIKSDFAAGSSYDGGRYGDYMLITSGTEKIGRLSRTLDYDNQTVNFTVGSILTGGTSGAIAVILEDNDSGATGTLTLGQISGEFSDDEVVTDSSGGSADADGTLDFTYTTITNAPIAWGLKIIGNRAYAFRLRENEAESKYSEVDDTSNPPFDDWTSTTAADDGGSVNFRNAGPIRSMVQLGQNTVAFSDNGFFAFFINTIDSAGTLKKVEVIQNYTEDYGGARGAIETNLGVFYINEAGLWQMVAVGQTDVPMSRQQVLTSTLLGSEYFKDTDQTSSDLVYDINQKCVFVTVAKDSPFNNLVIGLKPELENSMFEIQNWNINRFAKSGDTIYGASSVKTTVYKLFDGYDDDGLNIGTEYYQELPLDTLFHAHSLNGAYCAGFLTPDDELTISFDIYDLQGVFQGEKEKCLWTGTGTASDYDEWGSAQWGGSAWGGAFNTSGLVKSFSGGSPTIRNFQRILVRITSGNKTRHIINWISARTTQKQPIKRRNLTKI
jgi:hypothetical protein